MAPRVRPRPDETASRCDHDRDRGQAHTLEAIVGALLLLTSVLFALQSTAVTPLSASTSSQHIENQQQASARGVLAAAADNNSLKPAILYYNGSAGRFNNVTTGEAYYTGDPTDVTTLPFARMLERNFGNRGIAYNVRLHYQRAGDELDSQRYIYNGVPSDNAASGSWTVVLHDDDRLYFPNRTVDDSARLGGDADYVAADTSPETDLFNVVRVEVVVWRV